MVFVARSLARVTISSASIFEWVPYDFEQIISHQVSMSTCVGPPDPDEFLLLDVISSWVTFSKMTLSVLVSCLSIMADYFSSAAFGCFSLSFFLMSVVMSCFPLMSLAWFTILRAFFTCPYNMSLQKVVWSDCFMVLTDLLSLFWMASHSEISSSSFPCFHHFILLFKYLTRSLFFDLRCGFWSSSGKSTWSVCIATDSHLLLLLKSLIRQVTSAISVFPAFPLGICISFFSILQFFDVPNQDFFWFSLSLSSCPMWQAFHFGWFPYFTPCSYHIAIAIRYVCHSHQKISYIGHSTFQHTCSGNILCTLDHKTGPHRRKKFPDTFHIYSSWKPQRFQWSFRQVALANLHYNKPTISLKRIQR